MTAELQLKLAKSINAALAKLRRGGGMPRAS